MNCLLVIVLFGLVVGMSIRPYRRRIQKRVLDVMRCEHDQKLHDFRYQNTENAGLREACCRCGADFYDVMEKVE